MIDLLQVDHSRVRVELLEDVIRAAILRELRHGPLRIGGVAERDRARWTRRGARGRELVGAKLAVLERGPILRLANALHAEAALLHDTLAAHGHVRIELPVERFRKSVLLPTGLTIGRAHV